MADGDDGEARQARATRPYNRTHHAPSSTGITRGLQATISLHHPA
ncbi:MAG: hypothetical protein ABI068_02945 [Ktedonobacterales bacterium]